MGKLLRRIRLWLAGKDGSWHEAPYPGGMRRWTGHGWQHRAMTLDELQDRVHNGM